MSKFFTLHYLISSHRAGKGKVKSIQHPVDHLGDRSLDINEIGFEPSQRSMDAILNFASQYDVLHSRQAGSIELNLN